jgi:hypothetical protein
MALSPYSNLKAFIALSLERQDLTAVIPDMVTLAEGHMNADPRLRVREAEKLTDLYPVSGVATLPSGMLGVRFVAASSDPTNAMTFITPSAAVERYGTIITTAWPKEYTIIGDSLYTYPASSSDLRVSYYPKLSLVSDSDTNWLLTKYPSAYLYGTMAQAALYIHDDARVQSWSGMYEDILNKISANDASRYVGAGGSMRGPTP